MNDEHVNAAVIIWFLLWLLLVAASACWTLLTEEFSSQLHMLPAVASPLSLVRLKQSALWNLEDRFKKGPARSFLCASLLLSPRLHFLSNSLTADMKRPADRNTDDEDAQLTGRYSALHPSCRHFLLHTSKQSDVRPERFSLVVWITFCLQLLMEAESLILRVGPSRRRTMRKDEGRAGETLTRVDVHVWVWIKNKTFHFISKRLKNPEITCLTWRNRVKPSAPENRADRSDRIHSWWRLKTVPEERKQNLTEPEWREQNKTREVWSIIWSVTDTCWVWTQSFWSESNRTTRSAGVFQDVVVLLDLVCRQQTASCRILFEFCTELIKLVTSF